MSFLDAKKMLPMHETNPNYLEIKFDLIKNNSRFYLASFMFIWMMICDIYKYKLCYSVEVDYALGPASDGDYERRWGKI